MVGPCSTPSKSKEKQPAISSEESNADRSPGLKDVLIEPEAVYRHTRTRMGTNAQVDYNLLARGIEVNDDHSAIIKFWSSNSSSETTTFAYMAGTPQEMAKRFEEQARIQREQFNMIRTQQESIDTLKQMLSQLLKDKKKPKVKTPSKKSKGKRKEGESSSSTYTKNKKHFNSESPKSSSKKKDNSENESSYSQRMNKLEQHLEALANWDGLQGIMIVWSSPTEWDMAPYPPKFKASTLHTFDGKRSPN